MDTKNCFADPSLNSELLSKYDDDDETRSDISKADTVEDNEVPVNCGEIVGSTQSQEVYAYLQELNSGNLMQFSQQSVLQELLMKEQFRQCTPEMVQEIRDMQASFGALPTIDEHDRGGYKFQLCLNNRQSQKNHFYYLKPLNKIFVRMHQVFTIDVMYTPKLTAQQLQIRALLCFGKEISEPVLRCQNHTSKDINENSAIRNSFLRCDNPQAEYCGSAEGKTIKDRYAIVIPLPVINSVEKEDGVAIKHTLAFRCACQNSCVGRRELSVVFLLEDCSGEVLSQRTIDVKICTCPKRDKNMEEKNITSSKRKTAEDLYPGQVKLLRTNTLKTIEATVKQEFSSDMDDLLAEDNANGDKRAADGSSQPKRFGVQRHSSGLYQLQMAFSNKSLVQSIIAAAMKEVAVKLVEESEHAANFARDYRRLKRLHDKSKYL